MTDEKPTPESEDQVVPEADAEIQPDAAPADTAAPAAESTVESEPVAEEAAVTVAAAEEPAPTAFSKNKNLIIGLAIILISLSACFCLSSAGLAGWGFFGRGEEPTPTPAAPVATATAVPTPEPGQPPIAVIDAPSNVVVGEEFILDGGKSAGESTIVEYIWDFGDGTGGKDSRVKHTYVSKGDYTVTLTVTDKNGLSSSSSMWISAAELQPPTAVIQAPQQADAGEPVTFDGSGSAGGNPIVNYAWNFGDRNSGSGAAVEHVYNKAGQYTVTLTVTDNTGLTGESKVDIVINELEQTPPMAVLAGPSQAVVGQDVIFDASESTPGSSAIANYAWDFGNGETAEGKNKVTVTTQYVAAGTYAVVLTVTDENGLSSTANAQIVVQASLEDTTWSQIPALPEANVIAEFSRGKVSGFAGCNDYSGGYTTATPEATSGALTIQDLTATRKVCDQNVTAQENQYLTAFESVTAFTITGDTLTLTYPGGVLTYEALRAELH
jgi:PKD repeat protein